MSGETIDEAVFDHVAHAVHRWQDVWSRYATDLGAEWSSGGPGLGFAPCQLRFANGARVEVLMPNDIHLNDFLHRFLAASGPGPHHLTFKVPDLTEAIDKARGVGLEPIGIDRSDPEWMEAFIHPKQATGVVVQLAQAPHGWTSPPPDGFPSERRQRHDRTGPIAAGSLTRVTHAVSDLGAATALFVDLLGGAVEDEGTGERHHWIDLAWQGPLALRLTSPTGHSTTDPLVEWIGGRTGRIHHLELTTDEPEGLPGAVAADRPLPGIGDGTTERWVIEPQANEGLRLVVTAT
jgi:catechol 2,3-dioxygenase-like lactoylglutathione lyase family enzyme